MASISLQRVVADTFVAYIVSKIPGLVGKVGVGYADPGQAAPCLALRIVQESLRFEPSEPDEVYWRQDTDDGKVVIDVGQFLGHYTLQLYTTSPAERELYEQLLMDLFLEPVWTPGSLTLTTPTLTVNSYVSLYSTDAKFFLVSDTWREELTFEARRMTFLDVEVDFPALTTYSAVTIESLQSAIADLTKPISGTADLDAGDWIEIQIDGTAEPAV